MYVMGASNVSRWKKSKKCDENVKHLQKAYLEFYVEYNPDMKIS